MVNRFCAHVNAKIMVGMDVIDVSGKRAYERTLSGTRVGATHTNNTRATTQEQSTTTHETGLACHTMVPDCTPT